MFGRLKGWRRVATHYERRQSTTLPGCPRCDRHLLAMSLERSSDLSPKLLRNIENATIKPQFDRIRVLRVGEMERTKRQERWMTQKITGNCLNLFRKRGKHFIAFSM